MQAQDFIRKWRAGGPAFELNERAGAQAHFIDLCRVLEVEEPGDAARYCFERGVVKTGSSSGRTDGFADVWLKNHFAWEYKAPGKSLDGALKQLMMYALPLESPPLLVVSDRLKIEVHTHFTGTPSECHRFALDELASSEQRARLRWLWQTPEKFKPRRSNRDITEQAARTFADTAERLRAAGNASHVVSHFLTQCLFCFFAEDVGLLPSRLFERLVGVRVTPERLRAQLEQLFGAMRDGGLFGVDDIAWFNGGLFKTIGVPALTAADVEALKTASSLDWSAIDPSIFGTLFERGLDPSKRSQLGAHYTDPATILRLIEPVVIQPLQQEWQRCRAVIAERLARRDQLRDEAQTIPSTSKTLKDKFARLRSSANEAERNAQTRFNEYLERLREYRVLDAACGSGNFLYLALKSLKDIEHQINMEAEQLGLARQQDVTGPHNVLGIELNDYAAELARVTVWIGELQWRIQHGYAFKMNPVLDALDHIQCRDALLNPDGSETIWPAADALVGNPPFLGDKKMRGELGAAYTEQLRARYKGRVPGGADFVCYWFEKARAQIEASQMQRAGLVSTNSIRGGKNREVLDQICQTTRIFEAWSDQPWINNGAAVRVSLVAFGHSQQDNRVDGKTVSAIHADLSSDDSSATASDLTKAGTLPESKKASFIGGMKKGQFDVADDVACQWLKQTNPNGRSNAEVLFPWINGLDITRRPQNQWIVDFGIDRSMKESALFEAPFEHVLQAVKPARDAVRNDLERERWWLHARPAPDLRAATGNLERFIGTARVAKHRLFVWIAPPVVCDGQVVAFARADNTSFGILHSRFHELWSLRLGTSLEDRPRYTPTTCFETFPFPAGLTPANTAHQRTEALPDGALIPAELSAEIRPQAEAIAHAAHRLDTLRQRWLNPPEWTDVWHEVVPLDLSASPYPDRLVAKPGFEAELAKRTLTNLYNQRPAWLAQAHAVLDAAVATAYGWGDDSAALADEEILRRLLALNLARSAPA